MHAGVGGQPAGFCVFFFFFVYFWGGPQRKARHKAPALVDAPKPSFGHLMFAETCIGCGSEISPLGLGFFYGLGSARLSDCDFAPFPSLPLWTEEHGVIDRVARERADSPVALFPSFKTHALAVQSGPWQLT
ncbi:hypothetical protein MAPG_00636 [Magnaporthiopsis poae ATCC 64411]|uniref:Uncharacterized protein n=1 Tax=Magnaporthiopsis poae (strain ATCC 64411 / 73-15) TaxID=644358 RepID=A0A0C4DLJ2_MAGP6|nr:hypothetical protein MAPG_00636 [Magnaporthiopsis poae ATCC 64411]